MNKILQIGKKIALALVLLVTATVVNAATRTAIVSGPWNSTTTWSGGAVPLASDDVVIPASFTVSITAANAVAKSVTVSGILRFNSTTARSLTVSGGMTVNSGGSIDIQNVTGTHTMSISGNITNNGSIDLNLDADSRVALVLNGTANQTISGTGSTNDYYRITINNTGATNANIVEVSASSFTVPATGFLTLTDGIFKLSGTYTLSNPVFTTASYTIPAGTGIWINNSNVSVTGLNGDATVTGLIRVTSGNFTHGTVSGDDLRYATGSNIVIEGGSFRAVAFRNNGGADLMDFNMSGGLLTIPYVSYSNGGRSSFDIGTAGSTFTMSGGIIEMPFANGNTGGDFKNLSTTVNITGGTLQFGNASTTATEDDFDLLGGVNSAPSITIVDNGTSDPTVTLATACTVNGDLTINSGTSLLAGGQAITVKGNWTNNGTFTPGTQVTTFSGTSLQTITGTTTFSSVTVNNSGAGLSLASPVTVEGAFTLTDGVVASSSSALLTLSAAASVSGGSAAAHINGPMAKTGNTDFNFPVGDGVRYRPISVSAITGGSAASVITASYILGNPRTAYGVTGTGPAMTIKDISLCEYWLLDDGAETLSAKVGLQYSSTSPCNTNGYITDAATLVVAHHNGTAWESLGAAAGATLTNMTAANASTFSPFTIGTTNSILNPLPVSFNEVKAFEKGSGVQIDWTNATESDMSAYVIERSADGINFSTIGQSAPRSNQFDKVSYTFVDAAPLAGTNFYRIKAIELSGKNVYSKALRVDLGSSPKGISLYPNPVHGSVINIGFTAQKGQYSLNVLNAAGQIVYRQALNHAGGNMSQSVSLPASMKAGVYNVLISGDNYKETRMFVIQ